MILISFGVSTDLDHEIHVIGEFLGQLITSVCMSTLFHNRLRAGARRTEMLLGLDTIAFPDRVYAGNQLTQWKYRGLRDKNILIRKTLGHFAYLYPVVVIIEL